MHHTAEYSELICIVFKEFESFDVLQPLVGSGKEQILCKCVPYNNKNTTALEILYTRSWYKVRRTLAAKCRASILMLSVYHMPQGII